MSDAKGLSDVPPLPYTQEGFDRLNGPRPEVRVIELEAHNKALAERLNQAECNQELVELYFQREQKAIKERDALAERLKVVEAERDLQCTLKHNLINRLEECTAALAAARAEVDEAVLELTGAKGTGWPVSTLIETAQHYKQQNTRLKAALEDIQGRAHFLDHHELQAIIKDALTEPPEPKRGGFAAEQQH